MHLRCRLVSQVSAEGHRREYRHPAPADRSVSLRGAGRTDHRHWKPFTPDAFARWDAAEGWQIGKQGYRFDAASIVIGIGRAVTAGEDEGALIDAGTNEFVEHLVRQGAIEEEREGATQRERGTTVRVVAVLT